MDISLTATHQYPTLIRLYCYSNAIVSDRVLTAITGPDCAVLMSHSTQLNDNSANHTRNGNVIHFTCP